MRRIILLLAMLLAGWTLPARAAPDDVRAVAARLGRGVNVLGYDPYWKGEPARFRFAYFRAIRRGGLATVRVNLFAFDHMGAGDALDPAWLKRLDRVIARARGAGLNVVIEEHDFDRCGTDLAFCRPKLMAFWRQIAHRYRHAPSSLIFEILNEPSRQLTAPVWNAVAAEALAIIRQENPTRAVVIGPVGWNSLHDLAGLSLPSEDRHLIVAIHYYEPMRFTHQGAAWVGQKDLHGVSWGSAEDRAKLDENFDAAQAWAKAHDRPLWLGEFGAYEGAGLPLRAVYDAAVARAAETRGWPWAYWQFDGDFVVFDVARGQWIAPIHDALVPTETR